MGRGIDGGLGWRFVMLCGFGILESGVWGSALDIFVDSACSLFALCLMFRNPGSYLWADFGNFTKA